MRYRVDELAARAGVSVDTVRFYQSRGLLDPPRRSGRVALYGDSHLERLRRIRELKAQGFTLAAIRRLLVGDLDPADRALVAALERRSGGNGLSLAELAERTGVSEALLEALTREGLLVPEDTEAGPRYDPADAALVSEGLKLLQAGLPLSELLALARRHDAAMRAVARSAVDLFVDYVRDPVRAQASSEEDAARALVEAFEAMLPAATSLVANHFRRLLVAAARERIEDLDDGGAAAEAR